MGQEAGLTGWRDVGLLRTPLIALAAAAPFMLAAEPSEAALD